LAKITFYIAASLLLVLFAIACIKGFRAMSLSSHPQTKSGAAANGPSAQFEAEVEQDVRA
jgi:hypothetical protein